MTERDFVYWLQGYLEISGSNAITAEQLMIIKDHIKLVMTKVTPSYTYTSNKLAVEVSPIEWPNSKYEIIC